MTNRRLLADRDGVAYSSGDGDQFKRIVLCQALAIAYTRVMADCMARMTQNVQGNLTDEAIELYEHILRFNAAHYFSLPVLLERHELFAAWRVICAHYYLGVLNQELTQQLSGVAALLREQRAQQGMADEKAEKTMQEDLRNAAKTAVQLQKNRDDRKDKRRTLLLSLAGVFLTATSLLSLLQLSPKQFSENASAWKHWLFEPARAQAAEFKPEPLHSGPSQRKK